MKEKRHWGNIPMPSYSLSLTKCHYDAPTVLIIAYDKSKDWKNSNEEGVHSGEQDASIVATHMMLEAWELGIGSCWVNFFSPSQVAEEFGFPENITPVLILPIGCGTGKMGSVAFENLELERFVFNDSSDEMIQIAKEHFKCHNAEFSVCDI